MAISMGEIMATIKLRDEVSASAAPIINAMDAVSKGMASCGDSAVYNRKMLEGLNQAGKDAADAHKVHQSALESLAEKVHGMGDHIKEGIEHPLETAKGMTIEFVESLGPMGLGLLAVAGIAATVGTVLFEMAEKAAASGGQLKDLEVKTGITVPALSKLRNAAAVAGTDIDTLSNAVFMMQKRMEENPDKFNEGLSKLNLNVKEFRALSPEDKLSTFAQALKDTEDPATRIAAGTEIMGRQFRDVSPALAKLNEALEMTADITPFTKEEAEAGEHFEMMVSSIKVHLEAFGLMVAREVMPHISALVSALATIASGAGSVSDAVGGASNAFWLLGAAAGQSGGAIEAMMDAQEKLPEVNENGSATLKHLTDSVKDYVNEGNAAKIKDYEAVEAQKTLEQAHAKTEAAQRKHAEALHEYTSASWSYKDVVDNIGNALYEGIAFDHARGVSTQVLQEIYGTTQTVIGEVIKAEAEYQKSMVESSKAINALAAQEAKHDTELRKLEDQRAVDLMKLAATNYDDRLAAARTFDDELAKETMSKYDFEKRQIQQHLEDQRKALDKKDGDWQASWELDTLTANRQIELIEWQKLQDDIDETDQATADWEAKTAQHLDGIVSHFTEMGQIVGGSLDGVTKGVGVFMSTMKLMTSESGGMINQLKALAGAWQQLTGVEQSALVASTALNIAASSADPNTKSGQVLSSAEKGAQIGTSIYPGYGTLVGMGIGALVGALKVSPEEISAREAYAKWQTQIIDQFDKMATGAQRNEAAGRDWAKVNITVRDAYEAVGLSGSTAMADLAVALDATHHSAEDVQAALMRINTNLDYQKQDAADLDAAIKKYGFSIEELGPKMQKQKLTDQAIEILNNFRLLAGSGIAVDTVLGKMGGDINDFIHSALKTGTEVPSAMQPMLQKMVEMGTLTDENGNQITDLGKSGLTFSETMTQGFDRIVYALSRISMGLKVDLPDAANTASKSLTSMNDLAKKGISDTGDAAAKLAGTLQSMPSSLPNPFAGWRAPDVPDLPGAAEGGLVTANGVVSYMNQGGNVLPFVPKGTDTVPAMLTPGERVLTVQQNAAYERGGNVGRDDGTRAEIARLNAKLTDLMRDQQRAVAIAVADAMILSRRVA